MKKKKKISFRAKHEDLAIIEHLKKQFNFKQSQAIRFALRQIPKKKRRKKGLVLDQFINLIAIFAFCIVLLVVSLVLHNLSAAAPNNAALNQTYIDLTIEGINTFNATIVFVGFMFLVGILLFAFTNNLHPAFIVFSLLLLIVLTPVSAVISNVFDEIFGASTFAPIIGNFDIMKLFIDNFPLFLAIGGFLVIIVLYAKNQFASEVGV